ncbi:MAG TPA: hypothetical protein DDY31_12580 [Lachnospiraceae bacterium]|nr:hypothetical protein [Lachnospiraceae bacterium]
MNKKDRILKFAALMLALNLLIGNTANAAGYESFKYSFNYGPTAPSNTNHVSQTVEVWGGAQANAYAKCTAYSYTGNKPVLTVVSDSSAYPTNSTSFTGKTTDGQSMRYTVSIPPTNQKVTFRGSVSNYTSFIISAQVKG